MTRQDLALLFSRARSLCGETDYVVFGSLAVLGHSGAVPARMAASIDVDAYTKSDPARVFDLAAALGQGSAFESKHGFYLDPISPRIATLPDGWDERLVRIELARDVSGWFLDPADAAVSKYARMEPRDREWIRPGLVDGILNVGTLDSRFARTTFADAGEAERAGRAFAEDRRWLAGRKGPSSRRRR